MTVKSPSYYAHRLHDRLLRRLITIGQPADARFALAAYSPAQDRPQPVPSVGGETAFVFQGPVPDRFEAVFALYRAMFPQAPIVISTWESERPRLAWLSDEAQTMAVFLSPPARRGIMNVNMQIWSTGHGIATVRDAFPQVRRVAKLRMDHPPLRPDAIFPVLDHFSSTLGERRIWGIDINTSASLPFSFSDIFQIGPLDEMSLFWATEALDDREMTPAQFLARTANQNDFDEIIRLRPAEIFLTLRYLRHREPDLDPTSVADYHSALARYFGILDADQIGLAFDKYSVWRNGRSPETLDHKRFLSFTDWLGLVADAKPRSS